jgi:hypothetical protein
MGFIMKVIAKCVLIGCSKTCKAQKYYLKCNHSKPHEKTPSCWTNHWAGSKYAATCCVCIPYDLKHKMMKIIKEEENKNENDM